MVGSATSDVVCSVRNCPPFHSCVAEFVQASCIVDSPCRNICPRGMMVMPDCLWMHNPSEITAAVHMRWTRRKLRHFPSPPIFLPPPSHLFIPPPPPPPCFAPFLRTQTKVCLISLTPACCHLARIVLRTFASWNDLLHTVS